MLQMALAPQLQWRASRVPPCSETVKIDGDMIEKLVQTLRRRSLSPAAVATFPKRLERPFRVVIFDWDGTAVVDRREDASPLARLAEDLLTQQVWLAVVTGTNFSTINGQFCQLIAPGLRHYLLICANRGSQVFGFDSLGQPVRRFQRVATPAEDRALTVIADGVAQRLHDTNHLAVQIVYDRLNRRKIDLIPDPQWADPPKTEIGPLRKAVQGRLRAAHVRGGLQGVIGLATQLAREQGLDARITSDVKHIEVGLTDKADAVAWLKRELLQPAGIPWVDVLLAGDEFGSVAGLSGSDDRLRQGSADAPVVSVGVEPNGVPRGVLWLGGGPARFRALLARQATIHKFAQLTANCLPDQQALQSRREGLALALSTTPDPRWSLLIAGANPIGEETTESRLTVANGLLSTRGALEIPAPHSLPRLLVAGLFAAMDDAQHLPVLVSAPDWTRLRITLDGIEVVSGTANITRTLDMRRGVLICSWRYTTDVGTTLTLRTLRSASQDQRALAWHAVRLDVDRPAAIIMESWLEPLDSLLVRVTTEQNGAIWRTVDGAHTLALATMCALDLPGGPLVPLRTDNYTYARWEWQAQPDQPALYSRLVAGARDEDALSSAAVGIARQGTLRDTQATDFGLLIEAHERAWQERWQDADVVLEGDERLQIALRFALYHLISAANPSDSAVSIGARALTGDAYHGHVFWDTETFLLPFYTFCWPAAARALLSFRYRTLPAARRKATQMGNRGALYAWESSDTGEEETPNTIIDPRGKVIAVLSGRKEQHISADVAYAVWQYWMVTQDLDFLLTAGAEIILETARFWASRATREQDSRFHIRDVIGPDEYHESVDDDAYTNGMAAWNLDCGDTVAKLLAARWPSRWAELCTQLALTPDELAEWHTVAVGLMPIPDPTTRLIEQFTGFFELEQVDLAQYGDRRTSMDMVLGHERIQHAQVVKQADVVMLLALLWDRFDAETRTANFRYYEPRTGHGSSLDPAIHALVAARLGAAELAQSYFHLAIDIDRQDSRGNESLGVHIATLAGIWQAAVLGAGGVQATTKGIRLDPHLPSAWTSLQFPLQWHGSHLVITLMRDPRAVVVSVTGSPVDLVLGALETQLAPGPSHHFRWDESDLQWHAATPPEANR